MLLVFATSDKGGTGRSVTTSNLSYRRALLGTDLCYLDFDFGSPTVGAIFSVDTALRGTAEGGLHSYLQGLIAEPHRLDVWSESDRDSLRNRPPGTGRLVLYPGDIGGGEFSSTPEVIQRCVQLFSRLAEEYDMCLVDLSAGRSYATEIVLAATAAPELRNVNSRWLVFHRWTRQHIIAASGLVFGDRGIVDVGVSLGHDKQTLVNSVRFVRTAVVDPNSPQLAGLRPSQVAWLRNANHQLQELASHHGVGRRVSLGSVPLDPVLQWREQLITDNDVLARQVANRETVDAFDHLAGRLTEDSAWAGL